MSTGDSDIVDIYRVPQKKPNKVSHPREHWTRKKGAWKVKKSFVSDEDARVYISHHRLGGYRYYKCPYCGGIHIGYVKDKEE